MPRWERLEWARYQLGRPMTKREKHCFAKRKFQTEDDAERAAERLRRRGDRVRKYRCDDCGEWHVGRWD